MNFTFLPQGGSSGVALRPPRSRHQLLLIMKLTTFLLLVAFTQISARGVSQTVTLSYHDAPLGRIFRDIQKQTGYNFLCTTEQLSSTTKVDLKAHQMPLTEVLELCFRSQPVTYTIVNKTIVVSNRKGPDPESSASLFLPIHLTGTVTDSASGTPLAGVTVRVQGNTMGALTDASGNFTLEVESGSVLVLSYLGYNGKEVSVGQRTELHITLSASTTGLNQIVVIGYGTAKKTDVTTAISSITDATIDKLSITRVEQALQGTLPGVMVMNQNGQPGDKPMIRVRGTGTNNDPDPLYIVDGFPVSSIEYINPGDIARIDVLKDAASAAIYGARGANGVILITTKKGKPGKISLSYDGYYGIQNVWRKVPELNATQYATMMNTGATNASPNNPLPYPDPQSLGKGTNWQNALFQKNVPIVSHQVTASGGNEQTTYLTSFSYFDQQGVIGGPQSEFSRYTFRLNLDQKVFDFLRIGTNINYIHSKRRAIFDNGDQGGQVLGNAFNLDPITPIYETDPTVLATYNPDAVKNGDKTYGISPLGTFPNPLAQMAILYGSNKIDKLIGNAYAELNLGKDFKFRSSYSMDLESISSNSMTPIYYLLPTSSRPYSSVSAGFSRSTNWQTENVLSYSHDFGKHNIQALVGQSAIKYFYQNLGGSRNDPAPIDPGLAYIDVATDIASSVNNGGADVRTLASYFGRVAYDYDGKYLASAVLRRDGSSRFGRNNLYATFPSASAAWVISKEDFFHQGIVSFLKIRASWGQNGNENLGSSFPWASTINTSNNGYTFLQNGQEILASGASLSAISNPDLKWETSEQTDFGVDMDLWNEKVSVTADYYIKTTKGLLIRPSIPDIVGYSAPYVNGGNVQNKGVELGINYRGNITKDLGINASFNISHNVNKVTRIDNTAQAIAGANYINLGSITRMAVGEPIAYFWGIKTDGIFQTQDQVNAYTYTDPTSGAVKLIQPNAKPGDLKFIDQNHDGKINDDDRINLGDPNPKFTSGLTINLFYKSLDLTVFTIGMFGQKVFNGNYRFDKTVSNLPKTMLDSWSPDNTDARYPRFVSNDPNRNYSTVSDLLLEKDNFVRVKDLQLGYTLPEALTTRFKVNTLRVFVAVDNAFTFTKYSGFDPEIGATSPLSMGIDRGVYPQSRTFRFGVDLKL